MAHRSSFPAEDLNERARQVEETYAHETALLEAIAAGDEEAALAQGRYFMGTGMDRRLRDKVFSQRSLGYSVNTVCRKVAQRVGVHPVLCDEISERFAKKLELCTTTRQVTALFEQMYREYSRLCREYHTQGYSPAVKKALQYIHLNLSQDLSLNAIAQATSFSPGYLSHCFKEEVGATPLAYVASRRVAAACRLLERTDMTVREVAAYVSIPDWNYFTKIFRREKGCTPSQYRKAAKR